MDLGLSGRVAIVTGGSRGIGRAIAKMLASEGVDVAICARQRQALEEAAKTLSQETGRRIIPIVADTMSSESVAQLVDMTMKTFGRVDVLVNNASTPGGMVRGPLAEANDKTLLEDIDTKVVGYLRCAKAVAPHMQQRRWGRIINIGGLSGRRSGNISGLRNAAIVHLTKTLADELGAHGITVNLVHPGTTRTERTDAETERRAATNAIRRIVDASEIAQVVTFLASTKAANVTGVAIDASGGSIPVMFQ
ncbi:MAG TPA: SDR family NAD(P)-dependent oxidoreductase [Methylomirabilota bacterium]|jgi:NAD(P)-dependent dehydrogenase (short-subunit alcohol dehydrogenase family)